jgi:hypothetical protein
VHPRMPFLAPSPAVASAVLAGVAAGLATRAAWLVRGSTAVPAAAWAVAAALALAGEMLVRGRAAVDPAAGAAARLAVVALSLCPIMSLLGAKRPQHGVWQFIVATLAVVLALPAATALAVRPGSLPDVHPIERGLVAVVILVGWLNFLGTGRWGAATCVALGQTLLARGFLPGAADGRWIATPRAELVDLVGCGLVCAGGLLAAARPTAARRRPTVSGERPPGGAEGLAAAVGPAFLAVRETFGAAWTLRIAERFDELAAARGWPCRLRFSAGLVAAAPTGVAAADDWPRDALRALRALLLRFVSPEWLARHAWPTDAGAAVPVPPPGPT